MTTPQSFTPRAIARIGEETYRQKYQAEFEKLYLGKSAAINVRSGSAHLGDTAEEALLSARSSDPHSLSHLIRFGFPSAFQMNSAHRHGKSEAGTDWNLWIAAPGGGSKLSTRFAWGTMTFQVQPD